MEDLVSIIVPVYNTEKYIKECIHSLINQTYKNIEIILIDDGSTDQSYSILEVYQKKDSRIRVIHRENKGTIYTRLEGVQLANGKYLLFVDSDDWIEKETIEYCMNVAKQYQVDLVRFNMVREMILEKQTIPIKGPYLTDKYVPKEEFKQYFYPVIMTQYTCNPICGQLLKKELFYNICLQEYEVKMGDDLLTNLEIYDHLNSILFVNSYFYHYRCTENSITTSKSVEKIKSNLKDTFIVYSKILEKLKQWNMDTSKNEKIVSTRIVHEVIKVLRILLVSKEKNQIETIKYARNLIPENLVVDKNRMNIQEKLFIKRKENAFLVYTTITIKIPYLLKQQIKKILRIVHSNTRKNKGESNNI